MTGPKPVLLAALAGLAAGLGHAPFGLWPVSFLGFVALFWLVSRAARPFATGWAGGAGYFALTLHWIVEPFLVDIETHGWMAPFALVLLAGGLALFWGAAGWLAARMAGPRALAFAVALTAAEVVRGHVFTGFPWALPGYIWVDTPLRLAVAFTGSYGLTLLTLVAAALAVAIPRPVPGALAAAALLGLAALPGTLFAPSGESLAAPLGTVRLLQPNIPQAEKWDPDRVQENFRAKLDLTRGPDGDPAPDLVVWPEAAVVWPLDVAAPALERVSAAAGDVPFITGLNRREGETWHNSLAVVGPGGEVRETFDKVHLVPFGEYIPFRIGFIRQLAGTASNGFTPGEAVRLVDTPLGAALPLICYEGIFPGHLFRAGVRPDYLLLLTNDAWFGTFAGPSQHFDQARFRAAEHGLPLVRAANRGVSTVIDPWGNTAGVLSADRAASGDFAVPRGLPATLYARTGDWPVFALLVAALLGALGLGARNRIAKPAGLG